MAKTEGPHSTSSSALSAPDLLPSRRIRLWSLRTGLQLHSPNLGDLASPLNRQFSELIKALAFTGSDALSPHRRDDGALLRRSEREAIDAVWQGGGMGPKLWVGDGPGLESFSVEG